MLFYTGRGNLVYAIFIAVFFVGLILNKEYPEKSVLFQTPWVFIISAFFDIVACWLLGRSLNAGLPPKIIDWDYKKQRAIGHTFCFIRVEYCGFIAAFFYAIAPMMTYLFLL